MREHIYIPSMQETEGGGYCGCEASLSDTLTVRG